MKYKDDYIVLVDYDTDREKGEHGAMIGATFAPGGGNIVYRRVRAVHTAILRVMNRKELDRLLGSERVSWDKDFPLRASAAAAGGGREVKESRAQCVHALLS